MKAAICVTIAYLLGSVNFATLFSLRFRGKDIRGEGSGNPGFANALRVMGKKIAAAVFVCDCVKGAAAVIIAWAITGSLGDWGTFAAALAVLLGHAFPVFFGFRGGKSVSSTAGVMAVLDWRVALIAIGVYIFVALVVKISSLGSILAAISVPVISVFFHAGDYMFIGTTILIAALLTLLHRENIRKLVRGEERRTF